MDMVDEISKKFLAGDTESKVILYVASIISKIQIGTRLEDICLCGWCAEQITDEQVHFSQQLVDHINRQFGK